MTVADRTFPSWSFHHPLRRLSRSPGTVLDPWGPRPGETVADLGAGGGYFLPELLRRIGSAGRVYAVDVDAEALALAREVVARLSVPVAAVEFVHASAASVPAVPSGSVDYALSNGLLCCLVAKHEAMEEMWRILRPGGRALVTFRTLNPGWSARGRALRLTGERFLQLLGERPWATAAMQRRWTGRSFALSKPA